MLTKEEARELIREAVREALAERPLPSSVSVKQAAEILDVSTRTIVRMRPPRNGVGQIPYSWVAEALAAR